MGLRACRLRVSGHVRHTLRKKAIPSLFRKQICAAAMPDVRWRDCKRWEKGLIQEKKCIKKFFKNEMLCFIKRSAPRWPFALEASSPWSRAVRGARWT